VTYPVSVRARDTTPEAHEVQLALFRRMTPAQRAERTATMSELARDLALEGIRRRHPDYDDEKARHALFRLLVGDDLFRRAWPTDPLVDP